MDFMVVKFNIMIFVVMFFIGYLKLRIIFGIVSSSMVWDLESRLCFIFIYLDLVFFISVFKREGRLVFINI